MTSARGPGPGRIRTDACRDGRFIRFDPEGFELELSESLVERARNAASGMMDGGELAFLGACALRVDWSVGAVVVELGTFVGRTATFIAQVLGDVGVEAPVLSIDPFERYRPQRVLGGLRRKRGDPQGKYRRYLKTIREGGVEDRCLPMSAFSHHAHAVVPDRVGLLVIDGDHRYPAVAGDLRRYAPKVLPGGFVFLDDYSDGYPGVMRAVHEYFDGSEAFEIVHRSYFVVARRRG